MSSGSTPALSAFSAVSTANLQPEAVCLAKLDKIYLDLLHATTSVEKGNSAEVNANLRQLEAGIEHLREAVNAIAYVDTNQQKQINKIKSLYKQIKQKDELIESFKQSDFVQSGNSLHSARYEESVSGFWSIVDMYTFENVGFTHAVDGIKYLTCADCEFGPIGYVDSSTKLCLLAPVRLKVKEE
ncbi:hypothetical protein WR25_11359 [Diploscapter pachys]|uniref:Uncharacterized protein n=1 Tax=Diploscapter pachys TaxID=2018661 RepID=A0A2A2LDD4_9BILA|nr:hypothetical protein WR25_11359 [Diploscapter pachys]